MNEKEEPIVEIFSDGACSGNPGIGGYGAILRYGDRIREIMGCEPHTTNNRMELRAVIEALRLVKRPCRIRVVSDSIYMVKGMTRWLHGWIKSNWVNSSGNPVLNRDLWEELMRLAKPHSIEWQWIRGHAGHKENERCDELARAAIERCRNGSLKA
jgi:ribonuclease HI